MVGLMEWMKISEEDIMSSIEIKNFANADEVNEPNNARVNR